MVKSAGLQNRWTQVLRGFESHPGLMFKKIRDKYKLFMLVKKITSKEGVVHFTRWSIIETRLFNVYIHRITQLDKDKDMHDHPWNFWSIILWGGYVERVSFQSGRFSSVTCRRFLHVAYREKDTPHMIERLLSKVTYSFVVTGVDRDRWGYHTEKGWVDKDTYRKEKREASIPKEN